MRLYGLIGKNLGHSRSMSYFERKFAEEKLTGYAYRAFPLQEASELPGLVLREQSLEGLNVTIPFKESVLPYLHRIDETAARIGAVNVIRIRRLHGQAVMEGFNTDAPAFTGTLHPMLRDHHRSALVLGTGGASRAIQYGLQKLGLSFQVVSRQPGPGRLTYEDLDGGMLRDVQVIINATPLGMFPEISGFPGIPYEAIGEGHLLYDLVYNPEETIFLNRGRKAGATTRNGLEMFHLQAELSWQTWQKT